MKPEPKKIMVSDNAKEILDVLATVDKIELEAIKKQLFFSNKKWDKAIKELTRSDLAKVEKTEDGLFVSMI